MKKITTISGVKITMNFIIIFTIVLGGTNVFLKTFDLFFNTDEINLIRSDYLRVRPIYDVNIMFNKDILNQKPDMLKHVSIKLQIFTITNRLLLNILFLLIIFPIKNMAISMLKSNFFIRENLKNLKRLAVITSLWVVFTFVSHQLLPLAIPSKFIASSINYGSLFHHWGLSNDFGNPFYLIFVGLTAIDFKMLFVSIVLFLFFFSFKCGYNQKKLNDLTI